VGTNGGSHFSACGVPASTLKQGGVMKQEALQVGVDHVNGQEGLTRQCPQLSVHWGESGLGLR
jgi:hypothetical protein